MILRTQGTGAFKFQTETGAVEQVRIADTNAAVNSLQLTGAGVGSKPTISVFGADTNIGFALTTKGTGGFLFNTGGGSQFAINNVASASNFLRANGSNGANPSIDTNAGGLDISPSPIRFPGIGTTANAANATLNAVGSNDLLRSTSSRRYKTEIEALTREEAIALLAKLRPVTYASLCEQDDPYGRWPGLIAEEVFEVNPLF